MLFKNIRTTSKRLIQITALIVIVFSSLWFTGCRNIVSEGPEATGERRWVDTAGKVSDYRAQAACYDAKNRLLYAGFEEVVDETGTTEGRGVWKFDGHNWMNTTGAVSTYHVQSLTCDEKSGLVYASCYKLAPGEVCGQEPMGTGVWKYDGRSWADTGIPRSIYKDAGALAYDYTNNVLYASFDKTPTTGCVWKHGGRKWSEAGEDLSDYYVGSLACTGESPVGTGYPCLAFGGTRGIGGVIAYDGNVWTNTGGGVSGYWVDCLAYDSKQRTLYAGTGAGVADVNHFGHGVWKFDGIIWTDTGGEVSRYSVNSVAVDSANGIVYASCFDDMGGKGIWAYNGASWKNIGSEMEGYTFGHLAYDSNNNVLYAGCNLDPGVEGKGIWRYNCPISRDN